MAINYTTLLGLAQPVTGTESNVWGDVVNDSITALLDSAIAGAATISVTAGNVTLTDLDGAADQSRMAILILTGTPGTTRNVVAPSQSKTYIVINQSDASAVIKGSATTGVTVRAGQAATCVWNGADFEIVASGDVDGPSSATDNAVTRYDGTTGKLIQNSGVTIDDSNNVSGVVQLNATTVDTTNIEVTNLKAKDGTAAGSIADSTGVVTLASSVLTTTDINGGTVDGTTIGATTPSTVVATQVDITAQGDLRLQDSTGGEYVALQAPATIATSYTLTLPVDDGTSGQALVTDGSGVLSWSTAASGDVYGPASATDNAVARYDGTTGKIIQNSAVTIADDGATVIDVNSTSAGLRITQIGTGNALLVEDAANPDATPFVVNASGQAGFGVSSPNVPIDAQSQSDAIALRIRGRTSDNIGDIQFTDTGASTAYVNLRSPAANTFAILTGGSERMRIDSAGNVGIGASSVGFARINLEGTAAQLFGLSYGIRNATSIANASVSTYVGVNSEPTTQAASWTLGNLIHYTASPQAFGAGSTVTNQYGFRADSTLTGATNNFGFISNTASGTGRWNFYAAGTAANVFVGTTSIGGTVGAESLRVTPVASAVNYIFVGGSTTGDSPFVRFQGSDTNIGGFYDTTGNGSHTFRTNVYGGAPTQFLVAHTASAVNYVTAAGNTTGNGPYLQASGTDTNINFVYSTKGTGNHTFYTAGGLFTPQFTITHTASAVNYLQVTGAATGGTPNILATGSDTNVNFIVSTKGTGSHFFQTNSNASNQFIVAHTASAVNQLQVTGGATGNAAVMSVVGSDTNIDLALSPKGTGVLRFGTLTATSDVAITGYIEVKDSAGNVRKLAVIT